MDIQKQPLNINFAKGYAQKIDPYQVPVGNFEIMVNSVFNKVGRLTKRNGFPLLATLPNQDTSYLTTFNGNLTALGTQLLAYSSGQTNWVQKGSTYPVELSTLPLIRNSTNQSQCDSAIAPNGLICTVYTDQNTASLGSPQYKYCIADSITGQNIVAPTIIPVTSGTVTNAPRVFLLGNYFVIVFGNLITAVNHLQYVAISVANPTNVTANADLSNSFTPSTGLNFDGVVTNGNLYLAWNGAAASGIKMTYLQSNLVQGSVINPDAAHVATLMSVTADTESSTPIIWASYYNSGTSTGYTLAVDFQLNVVRAATQFISTGTILNLASAVMNSVNNIFWEVSNNYGYDGAIPTHYINGSLVTLAGVVTGPVESARSVGLASKAFLLGGKIYYLAAYQSPYQPTYFLIDGSLSVTARPIPIAKLAYSNGGGYLTHGLPNVTISGSTVSIPYLFKNLVQAVNKDTDVASGTQTAGVYSQTGVNLARFEIDSRNIQASETASTLNISGGFHWMYDGYVPVEQNFFLWPDSVEVTTATTGGFLADQTYYYQATYEWADNQGNIHRSAPSIPVKQVTSGGATSANTVNVPTLRLTYKISNPVKIVIYRWSTAQPIYYQVTSITLPTLNNLAVDSIAFVDTLADATILGNNIIYTTGGVLENINAPGSNINTLWDNRYWMVDAENGNLLWFSKQVIQNVPVEMSGFLTSYVDPTIGVKSSTGHMKALAPLDDKLIIAKNGALYYINGRGPDNTGANNQYSEPVLITSTVGTDNPVSLVQIPDGIMFQSDKGIWLLGRDLSTSYIGNEVESYNQFRVTSAVAIPDTNEVRFSLSDGTVLMYDYFVKQWAVFEGCPSISSTIYNDFHTIVNQYGQVSQELPGTYLDGSNPVLMKVRTSWLNLAGLRGYQRAYWFYLLGTFITPHKLQLEVAYDYNSSPYQSDLYSPNNYSGPIGDDPYYGGDGTVPYGGISNIEQCRMFFEIQRCKAFQVTITEVFDPSFGTIAGAGLTLSGLNLQIGYKKGFAPISASRSVG